MQESYFAEFELKRTLAKGSFGTAQLVAHPRSGERLVLKRVPLGRLSTRGRRQAMREIEVLCQCSAHPFICEFKFARICPVGDELMIYMEFCERGDLSSLIRARAADARLLDEDSVLSLFTQICLALDHIHSKRILHRDVKAQNVFVARDGTVRLGDFGISCALNKTGDMARTIMGTPFSLAPELCLGHSYDAKSDVWALGCLLYQLMTLRHAFTSNTLKELVAKILAGVYEPLPQTFSAPLRDLATSMLARNPNERPSVQAILRHSLIRQRAEKLMPRPNSDCLSARHSLPAASPAVASSESSRNRLQPPPPQCVLAAVAPSAVADVAVTPPSVSGSHDQCLGGESRPDVEEDCDGLFCFRLFDRTVEISTLASASVSPTQVCEQLRVFLEKHVPLDTLLRAHAELSYVETVAAGSLEFEACLARFHCILQADLVGTRLVGSNNSDQRKSTTASDFAELIQRLFVCEAVAFDCASIAASRPM